MKDNSTSKLKHTKNTTPMQDITIQHYKSDYKYELLYGFKVFKGNKRLFTSSPVLSTIEDAYSVGNKWIKDNKEFIDKLEDIHLKQAIIKAYEAIKELHALTTSENVKEVLNVSQIVVLEDYISKCGPVENYLNNPYSPIFNYILARFKDSKP